MDWSHARLAVALLLPSVACAAVAAPALSPDYALGTWAFDRLSGDGHSGTLTFLPNGLYVHMESGPADAAGFPGMQIGTYTFTPLGPDTASVSTKVLLDDNGEWGPNDFVRTIQFHELGTSKCFTSNDPTVNPSPYEICAPTAAAPVSFQNGFVRGTSLGNIEVVNFLANGVYLQGIDPTTTTFESGLYSIDGAGNLTTSHVLRNGGTDPTLSQLGPVRLSLGNGQLQVSSPQGTTTYSTVLTSAVPEPGDAGLMLLGVAAVTASTRRRLPTAAAA